jgi:hypothetical protein
VKATIRRSVGKHYGTAIDIEDGDVKTAIDIWVPHGRPSDPELEEMFGITGVQWEQNVMVRDGWGGEVPVQSEWPCDCHYESQVEWELCRKIADALNSL